MVLGIWGFRELAFQKKSEVNHLACPNVHVKPPSFFSQKSFTYCSIYPVLPYQNLKFVSYFFIDILTKAQFYVAMLLIELQSEYEKKKHLWKLMPGLLKNRALSLPVTCIPEDDVTWLRPPVWRPLELGPPRPF